MALQKGKKLTCYKKKMVGMVYNKQLKVFYKWDLFSCHADYILLSGHALRNSVWFIII